jgi:hypothetical protein
MGKTEFIAIQCYQCKTFQVGRQTKSNKWTCKLCNSKQSIRKIYAVSNQAKDIRKLIQKLNLERHKIEENLKQSEPSSPETNSVVQQKPPKQSKWAKYMPPKKEESDDEIDETVTTVLEEPTRTQRRKKRKSEQLDYTEDVNVEKRKKRPKSEVEDEIDDEPVSKPTNRQKKSNQPIAQKSSKWAKYMQPQKDESSDDDEDPTISLDLDQLT